MDNFTSKFTVSVAIVAIGYLLKRGGYLTKKESSTLAQLVMNFTIPASAIYNISQVTLDAKFGSIIVVSLLHNALLLSIAFFAFRKRPRHEKGGLLLLAPGLSLSSFTLPLLEGLHDSTALTQVAMLDIGNAPISLVGAYILAYLYSSDSDATLDCKKLAKSVLRTIPIMVYIVTIVLNVSKISYPPFVLNVASNIAKANMPCSFLMLGVALEFHFGREELLDLGKLLLLRYACGICVGLLLSYVLPVDPVTRFVIAVGLVAPLPLSSITYTKQFHYKMELPAAFANTTVLFSFFSAIFLYKILM